MPELPEVETVRRGLEANILGHRVLGVVARAPALRWPVPAGLDRILVGRELASLGRRGKYLLLGFEPGTLILHLGMSGNLGFRTQAPPPGRHDHFDIVFAHGVARLNDPRRFGAVLWHDHAAGPVEAHPLLAGLGIEPFADGFDGGHLHRASRGRRVSVKQFLLAGEAVVGVGNIYASESLHRAGIRPTRAAGAIGAARYERLADAIRSTLADAIEQGGTTLRDFAGPDGVGGYFQLACRVYGREGLACARCGDTIRRIVQQQRASYFCPGCQR
ncbi:MAG: bifunctional DNA-formamidopyrimidine glycosylase/DNA-(apurinic or apyrimidinic site) lyase [Burkholderiaceae bacterium]